MTETETVEVVHIVPPGRSIKARLVPEVEGTRGTRVHLKAKTIVKPGRYVGIDKAEMAEMVKRGELRKVALSDVAELPDNYDPSRQGQVMRTGTEENPLDADKPSGGGNVPRRNLDPQVLRHQLADGQINLAKLNELVRQRDAAMQPFDEAGPAIAWLCAEHDARPPQAPPPAPNG